MKIGILTYHRSQNYGALLQALAMQCFLEENDHEACFVDYWPSYHSDEYKLFSWNKLKKLPIKYKVTYCIRFLGTCIRTPLRHRNTRRFIDKYLHVCDSKEYDMVIYGSDQIWRRQNFSGFEGFNPVYFGEGVVDTGHKVAYAASMGDIVIKNNRDRMVLANGFQNFRAIGVREKDLKDFVEKEFDIPCKLVLDPVFLLSKEQWLSKVDTESIPSYKYIFHYRLVEESPTDKLVEEISRQTGLRVIEMRGTVPLGHYGRKYWYTKGPEMFLSLIYGASFIVASSFHGTALAVRFEKEFYLCARMKKIGRIETLLSQIGLSNRIIKDDEIRNVDTNAKIDYSEVNKRLHELENDSKEWLLSQIESVRDSVM